MSINIVLSEHVDLRRTLVGENANSIALKDNDNVLT